MADLFYAASNRNTHNNKNTKITARKPVEVYSIKHTIGNVVMLPISIVNVAKYQKSMNIDRVKRIVSKFDINRMRPIDVSFRDDKYWVYDGQHRTQAYYEMGFLDVPAIIHYGLTYEQEAYLFARQQDDVGAVNYNHKWNALVEANDPEIMDIVKLCKSWGFTILAKNNKGNNIKCVSTLHKLYNEFGAIKIGTILMCIRDAWGFMEHSSDKAIIEGIAKLVRTYPEQFDYNRLRKVLSNTTPKLILRDMEDKHHSVRGESRRAAYQICDLYNKNLSGKFKLNTKELDECKSA